MTKLCKEILAGDKVIAEDDSIYTVDSVSYGMWPGARIIQFTNGKWSQLHGSEPVQIAA